LINKDIIEAFSSLAKEKNIDRINLSSIIEDILLTMLHKKYGEDRENFSVIVNMEKGEIEIYQEKVIVDKVVDPVEEILLEDAQKVEPDLGLGDPFIEILGPEEFGRRLVFAAKQHLGQKIRDIEKNLIFEEYSKKVGEIVVGNVHQIQRDRIFVISNGIEIMLPKTEQIFNDRFRRGDAVRGIIKSVEITNKGPEIILSRSANKFLEKLFELEIPEIEDGIIEVKKISRNSGDRSKVVVFSSDRRIDAVGACVGMRGNRIQSIVRELNGEKIDIINWSDKPEILLSRALAPARPINLYLDEERPYVVAVFEDEELAVAIGKSGQNINLASNVTGYTIDAVKKTDYEGEKNHIYLDEISSISKSQVEELAKLEIYTDSDFLDTDMNDLLAIKGFGKKTVEKIVASIQDSKNSIIKEEV